MPEQRPNGSGNGSAGAAVARQLESTVESTEARDQRLAALRRSYRDGTYCVDAAKLAASIVAKHLDR